MNHFADPDTRKEDAEINTALIFQNDLTWLIRMVRTVPDMNPMGGRSDVVHFCICCARYLGFGEDAMSHTNHPVKGPHHLLQLVRSHAKIPSVPANYYISVQALRELQVPIGDVMSHVMTLPNPYPRPDAPGDGVDRCVFLHAQNSAGSVKNNDFSSGRCAFRECWKVFTNRQHHLRSYGITPQFCSINCKLNAWHLAQL